MRLCEFRDNDGTCEEEAEFHAQRGTAQHTQQDACMAHLGDTVSALMQADDVSVTVTRIRP